MILTTTQIVHLHDIKRIEYDDAFSRLLRLGYRESDIRLMLTKPPGKLQEPGK